MRLTAAAEKQYLTKLLIAIASEDRLGGPCMMSTQKVLEDARLIIKPMPDRNKKMRGGAKPPAPVSTVQPAPIMEAGRI